MTSFLEKLNEKLGKTVTQTAKPEGGETAGPEVARQEVFTKNTDLPADIYQNPTHIIVYIPAAGVHPQDFEVVLDEEHDLLTIRGLRTRPQDVAGIEKDEDGHFISQECKWDSLFRKIILPAEVDPSRVEAIFTKGVLVIKLPILKPGEGVKLRVKEVESPAKTVQKAT
ncbi:MAG: Hsp20/alpha crystallin family protein [Patescibacteria group bacterium]